MFRLAAGSVSTSVFSATSSATFLCGRHSDCSGVHANSSERPQVSGTTCGVRIRLAPPSSLRRPGRQARREQVGGGAQSDSGLPIGSIEDRDSRSDTGAQGALQIRGSRRFRNCSKRLWPLGPKVSRRRGAMSAVRLVRAPWTGSLARQRPGRLREMLFSDSLRHCGDRGYFRSS